MKMTKRLNQFVKEVATYAISDKNVEPAQVTFEECITEYINQIEENDYFNVVCYANYVGIKIPRALKSAL